jgi:NAD(P)-dependent dehydrogenase (short-subunit alcohol dehydrogenase family)
MTLISNVNETPGTEKTLAGHVAIVTGSSRGIGKAIAKNLAKLGAAVCLCGRNTAAVEAAAREVGEFPSRVLALRADVTDPADIVTLVHVTEEKLGPITLLINNAGIGNPGFGPVHDKSESDWDLVLNTNLKSIFLVSRAVAPLMIRRRRGDIINISSLAGKNTFAGGGLYCASKWGLQGLCGCMAEDLRAYGIRVSVICPGSVATDFSGRGPKDSSKVLLPEDVAHAVAMVAMQGPQSFLSELHLRPVSKP